MNELYDVVAVDLKWSKVRLIAQSKTKTNADAIETMAVMRRGVEDEFFSVVPHGQYKDDDTWKGTP